MAVRSCIGLNIQRQGCFQKDPCRQITGFHDRNVGNLPDVLFYVWGVFKLGREQHFVGGCVFDERLGLVE